MKETDSAVIAFGSPGQGWQEPGMADNLRNSNAARKVFELASSVFEFDVEELCRTGVTTNASLETNSQAAMGTVMAASVLDLSERVPGLNEVVDFHVSLGAYASYLRAGVLKLRDVFRILKVREELTLSQRDGAMAIVIGLHRKVFEELAQGTNASIAVQYADTDFAIAGAKPDIEEVLSVISKRKNELGRVRALSLPIPNSFHHPLLTRIEGQFANYLEGIEFYPPIRPVILNTGIESGLSGGYVMVVNPTTEGSEQSLRQELSMQLTRPARFDYVYNELRSLHVDEIVESSGGALGKVFRRLKSDSDVIPGWVYGS